MGNRAAVGFGLDKAETTVEDSVAGIVNIVGSLLQSLNPCSTPSDSVLPPQVENATREKTSGKFALFSGGEWPW